MSASTFSMSPQFHLFSFAVECEDSNDALHSSMIILILDENQIDLSGNRIKGSKKINAVQEQGVGF